MAEVPEVIRAEAPAAAEGRTDDMGGEDSMVMELIVLVIAIWLVMTYNALVRDRLKVDNQWSQIDVQLKMRADLIPNLLETVKGYMEHEKSTLTELTEARTRYLAASTQDDMMNSSAAMTGSLSRLLAVAENYPALRASENFVQLQGKLSDIEERIATYRQFYNDTVMLYNRRIHTVPSNLVASLFGFVAKKFWETDDADRELPKVQF